MTDPDAIYANGRTYEQHRGWLDSLEGDEKLIVYTPIGHLFSLALVAIMKRALLNIPMSASDRLRILDGIENCAQGCVTREAIAVVEPADDGSREIMREITRLPISAQVMAFHDGDVFRLVSKLNPSLLLALRICAGKPHGV